MKGGKIGIVKYIGIIYESSNQSRDFIGLELHHFILAFNIDETYKGK